MDVFWRLKFISKQRENGRIMQTKFYKQIRTSKAGVYITPNQKQEVHISRNKYHYLLHKSRLTLSRSLRVTSRLDISVLDLVKN